MKPEKNFLVLLIIFSFKSKRPPAYSRLSLAFSVYADLVLCNKKNYTLILNILIPYKCASQVKILRLTRITP